MKGVPPFRLWLEFEHWQPQPGEDPTDDCFNMQVELDDGRKYCLNVWTFRFLERARRVRELESEVLVGKYLVGPDLFVEKLDRPLLEQVVAELFATDQMMDHWLSPNEEA